MLRHPAAFGSIVALALALTTMAAPDSRVDLWPAGAPGGPPARTPEEIVTTDGWARSTLIEVPYFTVHLAPADRATGAGIVIVPGGGYGIVAFEHEGTDVARWLNERGISAFVLRYRHAPDRHPAPLRDVLRALRLVRSQATAYQVRPDRIGVLGFSAGGHLAASAATMFDSPEGRAGIDDLDAVSARPDFAVLIYPVITLEPPHAHAGSRENLLGVDAPAALVARMSAHTRVTPATPPLFLLHAADDDVVPVENIHLMHAAALAAGVPAELHIFEKGGHGFGMRTNAGPIAIWPELVLGWMRERGVVP
jgi:acetyl esterase/lipase